MKRTPNKLIGDELDFVKDWIEKQHELFFSKHGYTEQTKEYIFNKYPPLSQLNKNYCYVVYSDDFIKKWEIPSTNHHKKQEDDSFGKLSGLSLLTLLTT